MPKRLTGLPWSTATSWSKACQSKECQENADTTQARGTGDARRRSRRERDWYRIIATAMIRVLPVDSARSPARSSFGLSGGDMEDANEPGGVRWREPPPT